MTASVCADCGKELEIPTQCDDCGEAAIAQAFASAPRIVRRGRIIFDGEQPAAPAADPLAHVRNLALGWDSYEAKPPTEQAIATAEAMLLPPTICPGLLALLAPHQGTEQETPVDTLRRLLAEREADKRLLLLSREALSTHAAMLEAIVDERRVGEGAAECVRRLLAELAALRLLAVLTRSRFVGDPAKPDPLNHAEDEEPILYRGWTHGCEALLQPAVRLWIPRCPHCGMPRPEVGDFVEREIAAAEAHERSAAKSEER
jgi:hypothetical protein